MASVPRIAVVGSGFAGRTDALAAACEGPVTDPYEAMADLPADHPYTTVGVDDVDDSCSGISGTYGWKAEKYDTSMAKGTFDHVEAAAGRTDTTECPTCAVQVEHGTGYEARRPLELLEAALVG